MQENKPKFDDYLSKWAALKATEGVRWLEPKDRLLGICILASLSTLAILTLARAPWYAFAVLLILATLFVLVIRRDIANNESRTDTAQPGITPRAKIGTG